MKRVLFLDLEETIIKSWDNVALININAISNFIKIFQPSEIHIFSYAIWDETDKDVFDVSMKDFIERRLNIQFMPVVTVDTFIRIFKNILKCNIDRDDFFSFGKKQIFFPLFCNEKFHNCECVLIDDKVTDDTIFFSKNNVKVIIKNIESNNLLTI